MQGHARLCHRRRNVTIADNNTFTCPDSWYHSKIHVFHCKKPKCSSTSACGLGLAYLATPAAYKQGSL